MLKSRRMRRTRRRAKRSRPKSRSRSLAKKIKSVIGKETETRTIGECLVSTRDALDTTSYNVLQLNNIAQQASYDNTSRWNFREGLEYFLVGSRINFHFINYSNGAVGSFVRPMFFRVMVIEAKTQLSTITPSSATQMFVNPESDTVSFSAIENKLACMNYKIDNKRFKTHFDRIIKVGHDGNGNGIGVVKKWLKFNTKVKCREEFSGDALQDKMFYLVWFSYDPYQSVGETPGPTYWQYQLVWKTYFKDP